MRQSGRDRQWREQGEFTFWELVAWGCFAGQLAGLVLMALGLL